MTVNQLKQILYYEKYVIIDPGDAAQEDETLERGVIVDEERYSYLYENYGDTFVAEMGASAIKELLMGIDLDEEVIKAYPFTQRRFRAPFYRDGGIADY